MRLWKFFLLCSITFNVNSAELSPAERMLNAMGIDQVLSQAKEAQAKSAQEQVTMVMRQLSGTLAKVPEEKVKEIEVLFQAMMVEITNSWTTEEAVKVYSQTWADNYTNKEILAVVEKYEQPESQQELQMVLQASSNLNEYILGSYNKSTEVALAKTLPKVQSIIKDALKK